MKRSYCSMADGYLIEITTPQMSGDAPLKELWYAHIPDEGEAVEAVRKKADAIASASIKIVKSLTHLILVELSVPEDGVSPYGCSSSHARLVREMRDALDHVSRFT